MLAPPPRQQKADPVLDPVWRPIEGTSQERAMNSRAHVTLYTGARGPGKTDCQLMKFRSLVGKGYGAFWRGIIFDREYKNLDDLVNKSQRWFHAFNDGAKFLSAGRDFKWIWPTGEELLFRSMRVKDDYWNYHGQEFPFIGWNELCKYPNLDLFDMMMSCNRSSFTPEKDNPGIPPIPLQVFATTNPYGAGHQAVKRRFIDVAPYGKVVRTVVDVFNPRTQQREPIERTQVTIFGSYKENIYLAPEYIASLETISDENQRKAWLYGDWEIVAGGAISDLWRKDIHVLPRFRVPSTWHVDRSLDWGSSTPFSVGWWAEANGEEAVLPDGSRFCPPPGTLVQLHEWYGAKDIGTNVGLKLSANDLAEGILQRERMLMSEKWAPCVPWPGPADNQIRDVREIDVDTIEKKMGDHGVRWEESDKTAGSRRNGLQLMRDRLEGSIRREGPGLYFMQNCQASIQTIPSLPRDEVKIDDVDCWVAGTMIDTITGPRAIETIKPGDFVCTPIGAREVTAAYVSGPSATVWIDLSNGLRLEGTAAHKIYVRGEGLVALAGVVCHDILQRRNKAWRQRLLCIWAKLGAGMMGGFTTLARLKVFTGRFGLMLEDQFRRAGTFITSITIMITMPWIISHVCLQTNMRVIISVNDWQKARLKSSLLGGALVTRGRKRFVTMRTRCSQIRRSVNLRVQIVNGLLKLDTLRNYTAPIFAGSGRAINKFKSFAQFVGVSFGRSAITQKRFKPVHIVAVGRCEDKKLVYNLTVDEARLFYANGILSSNTAAEDHAYDMCRYRVLKGANRLAKKLKILFSH